ncbi:M23 family metallopeptidase [Streptomyces sp. SCSIO 30461]|uniref:M23 family metallopeptidase n=1 Tax=Streptomyces sp. SCSIO 30461 TaxID=3118085 RepID=UPI00387E403E
MASNEPALQGIPTTEWAPAAEWIPSDGTEEWNPTEESLRPVRGRHRVVKQRGGGLARSSTVLGVGVIAAVGAGGIATAQDKPAVSISLPDSIKDNLPDAQSLPGVASLMSESSDDSDDSDEQGAGGAADAPLSAMSVATTAGTAEQTGAQQTTAGEALRARILQQAEQQQAGVEAEARAAAENAAAEQAAAEATRQQSAAEAAAAEAKRKAEEEAAEAAAAAEAARLAELAGRYALPTSSYTITSTYGESGSMWSSGQHTGLDFAAPTGTPAKAVHGGTVKSAGWSGSYGYRVVLELEDGTEIWYAHLSSMSVSAGQKVGTGDTVGRVGATGNVTGPHLHLEVHTPSGAGVDPAAWLRDKGLSI